MPKTAFPASEENSVFPQDKVLPFRCTSFIQDLGIRLELPQNTIATAIAFWQRFFDKQSIEEFEPYDMAQTCVFVAGKAEETSRRLRDIINTAYRILYPAREPLRVSQEYWDIKARLSDLEHVLLRALAFNVDAVHPHRFVLHFLEDLKASRELANVTWSLLNDSLRTTLYLQYEAYVIAIAAIYVASELLSVQLTQGDEGWWEAYGAHSFEIEDCGHQILALYETAGGLLQFGQTAEPPHPSISPRHPLELHPSMSPRHHSKQEVRPSLPQL